LRCCRGRNGKKAYIGGSLGTLIGADQLNLGSIRGLGAPVASIGGAGTFDGIFLIGIVAVLIAQPLAVMDIGRAAILGAGFAELLILRRAVAGCRPAAKRPSRTTQLHGSGDKPTSRTPMRRGGAGCCARAASGHAAAAPSSVMKSRRFR
jgi:uncharacterized protein DUF1614